MLALFSHPSLGVLLLRFLAITFLDFLPIHFFSHPAQQEKKKNNTLQALYFGNSSHRTWHVPQSKMTERYRNTEWDWLYQFSIFNLKNKTVFHLIVTIMGQLQRHYPAHLFMNSSNNLLCKETLTPIQLSLKLLWEVMHCFSCFYLCVNCYADTDLCQ